MANGNATTIERRDPDLQHIDTTPEALAVRFGNRAKQLIHEGRQPGTAARLAASFAAKVLAKESSTARCVLHAAHMGGHIWVDNGTVITPILGECRARPSMVRS